MSCSNYGGKGILSQGTEASSGATQHPPWMATGRASALGRMGMKGEFNFRGRNPVKVGCCQYLNNVVEQDHRRVKGRLRPMLGFKTFYNGRRGIIGIELAQKIHKRQFAIPIPWQSNPAVIWRHLMAA